MPKLKDRTGQRFGKLVAQYRSPGPRHDKVYWTCLCDCGATTLVDGGALVTKNTTSCGCVRTATIFKHGYSRHPLYHTWKGMMRRCYNPKEPNFANYGANGIRVCAQWHSVEAFILDNEHLAKPGLSIERINNDGDYEPSNCTWASNMEQTLNRRITKNITFQGKTQCITHWAKELGIKQATLHVRIREGWSIERAFTEPVRKWPSD